MKTATRLLTALLVCAAPAALANPFELYGFTPRARIHALTVVRGGHVVRERFTHSGVLIAGRGSITGVQARIAVFAIREQAV